MGLTGAPISLATAWGGCLKEITAGTSRSIKCSGSKFWTTDSQRLAQWLLGGKNGQEPKKISGSQLSEPANERSGRIPLRPQFLQPRTGRGGTRPYQCVHRPHAAPFRGCDSPHVGGYFFNGLMDQSNPALPVPVVPRRVPHRRYSHQLLAVVDSIDHAVGKSFRVSPIDVLGGMASATEQRVLGQSVPRHG